VTLVNKHQAGDLYVGSLSREGGGHWEMVGIELTQAELIGRVSLVRVSLHWVHSE
jgi:hypothetical protein